MRGLTRPTRRRELLMNYVGSLGYYFWHFAWVLLFAQIAIMVSRYLVVGERVMLDVPATSASEHTPEAVGTSLVGVVLVSVLVAVCVIVLPYYLGKLSRKLPRLVLAETSWSLSRKILLRIKMLACIALVVLAIVCIFVPAGMHGSNLGFLVVLASSASACVCFIVQHKLATLWRVPERYIF